LVIDESMDNELRDNKNILTNLSNHENQNQVILLNYNFIKVYYYYYYYYYFFIELKPDDYGR